VYDREGYIRRLQIAAWVIALGVLALMAVFNPRDIDDEGCSMAFLGLTWGAIGLLVTLIAAISVIADRRRGFLELVLITPMSGREILDGTFGAVWEHIRRLYWLPWVLGFLFTLTGASLPHGILFSLITATLFGALIIWHGIACSLTARTLPGALVATLVLPLTALVGTLLPIALFEDEHGPPMAVLSVGLLVFSWFWIKRRLNLASVTCFLTAGHLSVAIFFTLWTYDGRADEFPVVAMHPGFLTIVTLDDRPERWFRRHHWLSILPCYWAALVINLWLIRAWLIRHFDRLAGRAVERVAVSRVAVSVQKTAVADGVST
jgi:hypothetical protein